MDFAPRRGLAAASLILAAYLTACGGSVVGGGGGGGASGNDGALLSSFGDEVQLRVADFSLSCSDPNAGPPPQACSSVDASFRFPLEALVPGTVPAEDLFISVWEFGLPDDCNGNAAVTGSSGGYGISGTLTFESVEATKAVVTIAGIDDYVFARAIDGTYTVPRCDAH